jgi:Methyltransferase domain
MLGTLWSRFRGKRTHAISVYYDAAEITRRVGRGHHRGAIGGLWDEMGQLQLDFLTGRGLTPDMALLDIGCGSLRAGVRFVDYLGADNYFGTDLNKSLLDAGYRRELTDELRGKLPRDHLVADGEFDFSWLPRKVDMALAQSVFTHLPLNHARVCLTRLAHAMKPGGKFFMTFFECGGPIDQPIEQMRHLTTTATSDPYHYYADDFRYAAKNLPWEMEYIGDWKHPRNQRMLCFRRA